MTICIQKLSPVAGAEVTGVDLAKDIGDNLFETIRQAWHDAGGVLVFRDQRLTPEQQIAFSRRFGELYDFKGHVVEKYVLPGYPQIFRVSNKVSNGQALGRARAGTYWHSDQSYDEVPPSASLLYGLEIPPLGGDTIFTNLTLAYEALSERMKAMLDGLQAVHSLAVASKTSYARELEGRVDIASAPSAAQPVVRTHPETGRKCLFVNPGFTSHILDVPVAESEALLTFLFKHVASPEFTYRHRWRLNDLVMWDNRCALHYAVADYTADRYMHRTTVIGDRAY